MKEVAPFSILDDIARQSIPDDADLIPGLATRLEKPGLMKTARSRPLVAILIALLILLALTGAAYALGRSLGYIPGVGLVGRDDALRVLAKPVSIARDGVTVTVEDAILSSDKTVIRFLVSGSPLAHVSQDITKCDARWGGLKLSDGSMLRALGGYGLDSWGTGYEARFTFGAVPQGPSTVIFIPPCVQHYLPGALAEDWELTLRFAPAPAAMTMAPVIELTHSQAATSGIPMLLEQVVETGKGYIVIGKFRPTSLPQDEKAVAFPTRLKITDANGRDIPYSLPNLELGLPFEKQEPGVFSWAFETDGKSFAWPLTITADSLRVEYQDGGAEFQFDVGPNPEEGQAWNDPNIDLELAGHPVRLVGVLRTADGYQFSFESKSSAVFGGVQLAVGNSAQGLTGMDGPSLFSSEVKFVGKVPSGKLTVVAAHPLVDIPGVWKLQWEPDHAAHGTVVPTPTVHACLTLDSWKAASSNPAPIPADQNNKVLITGRIVADGKPASEENTGIYISRLDGSEQQRILQGHNWASPSSSPDGSQVVYDGVGDPAGGGLHIVDLATGDARPIPNTTSDDMAPLWSPDGTRIAFIRFSEQDLYLVQPDGSGLQKITGNPGYEQLVGWWPDGSALIYGTEAQDGRLLRKFDLKTRAVTDLFTVASELGVSISPDGSHIAFETREPPASTALYVARLDGSDRRRVAFMNDYLGIGNPQWSSDGNWLLVNVIDVPNMDNADASAALVNLQTCQVVSLPIVGTIRSWVR